MDLADARSQVLRLVREVAARFVELQGIDRAMALAGQGFAALLPLLIVVDAVAPAYAPDVADTLVAEFRLSGSTADALRSALSPPSDLEESIGVLGVALLVISALSFTRALQRLYVHAWRLPPLGLRGSAWGALWLAAFIVLSSLEGLVVAHLDGPAGAIAALALSVSLWLATPWILLARRLSWRHLLPQAVITAAGLAAVSAAAAVYAPRIVGTAQDDFGIIGVGFALLTLLFIIGAVLVLAAALGATLARAGNVGGRSVP